MELLSEDDLNLKDMTLAELEAAWEFWFELAQYTNDFDPSYTHGVFAGMELGAVPGRSAQGVDAPAESSARSGDGRPAGNPAPSEP